MSETKFTKGPWVIIEGQFDSEVEVTTDSRQENSKGKICGMDIYFYGSHGVEQSANAHLIAAAPEMYEMLQELYETLGDEYSDDLDNIETLLKKARGDK